MNDPIEALDRRFLAIDAALEPEPGEDPTIALAVGIAILTNQLAASHLMLAGLAVEPAWTDRIEGAIQDAVEATMRDIRGRN